MLIRFVVSNLLSFDKDTEFNMIAGNFKTHKHHVYNLPKLNVLKAAAIYGANGAGKSNLIKGLDMLRDMVLDGEIWSLNHSKFKLNKRNAGLPISFEVEFYKAGKTYEYGLTLNNSSVLEEWLYETGITKEDKLIFERKLVKNKTLITLAKKYQKTERDRLLVELMEENLLQNDELLIGKFDSLKVKEFNIVLDWFYKLMLIFPDSKFGGLVPLFSTSDDFKSFANELMKTYDTGLRSLEVENIPLDKFLGKDDESLRDQIIEDLEKGEEVRLSSKIGRVMVVKETGKYLVKKVVAIHHDDLGKPVVFDLHEESDGTQRMLDFIPAFDRLLRDEGTVVIDEIDQSLHPVLLKALIQKTMADEGTKGQLIFTTHESNLLDMDIFRQDEIWFVEKDKISGSSNVYSLSDFKPRYDLDIKKGYLKGRFGAIPFLADLKTLNWSESYED